MAAVQTPEVLQMVNNAIVNIVAVIETWGMIVFYILLFMFVLWVVWNLGWFLEQLFRKSN